MSHPALSSLKRGLLFFLFIIFISVGTYSQWTQQVSGTQENLHTVYFINNSVGFLGSNIFTPPLIGGEIIRTSNGGDNWQRVLLDTNFRVEGFYFFDQNTGFAVGGSYSMVGYIYKTINGGLNWSNATPPNLTTHLFNIMFLNSITGYAGGSYGVVKTTDGGTNWTRVLTVTIYGIVSWGKIYFNDVNTGFFASDSGRVFKTINGGSVWTVSSLTSAAFRDIKFTDNNTGYIVGDNGVIFKTTNQGASWNLSNSGLSQNLFSVFFTDLNTGYITAEQTVLKTTNAGSNWFSVFSFGADSLFSSYFINANTGYTCGDEGRVYKTTTGGVIGIPPISTEVPKDFSLFQNYPNPFNPTTSIRFGIANESFVKLAVYDMLGREIEILVNENLSPATYEVKWNADKFSSGIYFYRIQADDYNDVKKMSVIK